MLRRRAGTSNPMRAVLRVAVVGGLPTAREAASRFPGAWLTSAGPEDHWRMSQLGRSGTTGAQSFTADGTARPRVHFAPQESTPLQGKAL
jgi:hypothetical protein